MSKTKVIYYNDCPGDYAVELFDRVEVRAISLCSSQPSYITTEGVVTAIHPRSRTVTVRYVDLLDTYRTTGSPKTKTVRAHVSRCDLIARDG